jgi:hypothetical protein
MRVLSGGVEKFGSGCRITYLRRGYKDAYRGKDTFTSHPLIIVVMIGPTGPCSAPTQKFTTSCCAISRYGRLTMRRSRSDSAYSNFFQS